jgi:hypothetical protein
MYRNKSVIIALLTALENIHKNGISWKNEGLYSQIFLMKFWTEFWAVEQIVSSSNSIPIFVEFIQFVDQTKLRYQEKQGIGKFSNIRDVNYPDNFTKRKNIDENCPE